MLKEQRTRSYSGFYVEHEFIIIFRETESVYFRFVYVKPAKDSRKWVLMS